MEDPGRRSGGLESCKRTRGMGLVSEDVNLKYTTTYCYYYYYYYY